MQDTGKTLAWVAVEVRSFGSNMSGFKVALPVQLLGVEGPLPPPPVPFPLDH